jgi:hypothetical protein
MVSREVASKTAGTEVATIGRELPLTVVQSFTSFDDVENYFASQGIALSSGEEISDGFESTADKDQFINTSLVLIDWHLFESSEFGGQAMTIRAMTLLGGKYRISDGSTGIMQQLMELTEVRLKQNHPSPNAGLIVRGGLSKSVFWVSTDTGKAISEADAEKLPKDKKKKASTYYLAF